MERSGVEEEEKGGWCNTFCRPCWICGVCIAHFDPYLYEKLSTSKMADSNQFDNSANAELSVDKLLFEVVRQYPVLYAKANKYFKGHNNEELAWQDITQKTHFPSRNCRYLTSFVGLSLSLTRFTSWNFFMELIVPVYFDFSVTQKSQHNWRICPKWQAVSIVTGYYYFDKMNHMVDLY